MSTIFHPDVLTRLRSAPELFELIAEHEGSELSLQHRLRAEYDDHVVRAALILTDLRHRGAAKFSRASEMWFDRTALEQSTSDIVAAHKARRFSGDVVDICAGIGGDSIAIARHASVTSIERVASRALCLEWNAAVYDVAQRVSTRIAEAVPQDAADRLVHIDPDRRSGQKGRSLRIADLEPGPEFLNELIQIARGGAVKLSPASNFRGAFDDHEVELISTRGECKEAVVWFGALRTDAGVRASIAETGESIAGRLSPNMADLSRPLRYLFDPDPALVRSGLLDGFAINHGLQRMDLEEEYLTGESIPESGFVAGVFALSSELPFDVKVLKRHVREQCIGRLEIKARRVPVDIERLRRKLRPSGKRPATLIITRLEGQTRALFGDRVSTRSLT